MDNAILSAKQVVKRLGCKDWHLRRLFDLERIAAPRCGRVRVLFESDLPRIEKALRAAGFLPQLEDRPTAA